MNEKAEKADMTDRGEIKDRKGEGEYHGRERRRNKKVGRD
jgi:hypothetical protein